MDIFAAWFTFKSSMGRLPGGGRGFIPRLLRARLASRRGVKPLPPKPGNLFHMKSILLKSSALLLAALSSALAADKFTITVTNDFAGARPAETISIPWAEVNKAIPHALLQHIAVKDAK